MIVSAVMAFIVVRNFDEAAVAGPSYVITFGKTVNGASGPRVAEMVEAFAHDNGVNVGRLYNDPRMERNRRIYLAVGDPEAASTRWLADGYPYFSREANVELRPYREIVNIYPDGLYYVYGSEQAATALLKEFALLGYHGEAESVLSLNRNVEYFGKGALWLCFLIVGFVTIIAVASAVTLNAKSYGIQRLHGRSFTGILWRDLTQLARFCAAFAAAVCAATIAALYFYNGLNQFATFALIALAFAGIFALAALATHVVTLALVHQDEIVNAVKGEVTARWAIAGAYLLRIAAIVLMFSVGISALVSAAALKEYRQKSQTWAESGSAYYLRLGPASLDEAKGKAVDDSVGQWIRTADSRGEAALASRQGASTISGTDGRDVLVVNNKYLTKHEIYDASGARVRPGSEDTIRVLTPQRYAAELTGLVAGVNQWASFQAGRAGATVPRVQVEQTRDHQLVLSYARSFTASDLLLRDPIIVVVTGTSGVIANDQYTSIASRGEILFEDPDRVMAGLTDVGAGAYVLGLSPFAQEAADKYRDARRELILQVFNLAVTVAVLLITALALSIVYTRRNAQALFVKYIHGWAFLRTHRWILASESVLALLLVIWTWHRTTTISNSYKMPGAPPEPPGGALPLEGWEPVLAGGVALLSLTLLALALKRTNATFIKTHSASLS
ncbi:bacteriocin-associated integral membrane family protein [Micromonospora azadirachtae]|uniref:Bacteriocin-associated integral membrane family protein n=1 Tax=Micromonospora azadirachtae TaxID=1970735 RepID=A0ABW2ZZC6_9ACTN